MLPKQDLDYVFDRTCGFWEEVRGERFFITGGSGFFGCWLLETLLDANTRLDLGLKVVVLTRSGFAFARRAIKQLGIQHLIYDDALDFIRSSVESFPFLAGEYSHVIHAAVDGSDTLAAWRTNVHGTERVLEFAEKAKTQRLLFLSSGAVYGNQSLFDGPVLETCKLSTELTPRRLLYANAKRAGEALCWKFGPKDTTVARCFSFFGPYMKFDQFAAGRFLLDAAKGGPVTITDYGDLEQALRSYLPMRECMVWLWTIMFRGIHVAYNVGSPYAVGVSDFGSEVATAANVEVNVVDSCTPPDCPYYVPAVDLAQSALGLDPPGRHDAEIPKTLDWIQSVGMIKNLCV